MSIHSTQDEISYIIIANCGEGHTLLLEDRVRPGLLSSLQ